MSRDVEQLLAESLRAHATLDVAAEVDTGVLASRAAVRGRELVRRRYTGFAALAVAAVATVGVAAPLAARFGTLPLQGQHQPGAAPAPTTAVQLAASPVQEGVVPVMARSDEQGAQLRPDLVGRNPAVLHFDIDKLLDSRSVSWATAPDLEIISLERSPEKYSWITLASDGAVLDSEIRVRTGTYADDGTSRPTTVKGKPAVLRTIPTTEGVSYLLGWEPVDGVYAHAHVRAGTEEELWSLVDRLRLDRSQKCALPVGVTKLPRGSTLTGCRVEMRGYDIRLDNSDRLAPRLVGGELRITGATGMAMVELAGALSISEPNASPSPDEAQKRAVSGQLYGGGLARVVSAGKVENGDLRLIGDGLVVGTDLNRPETWPAPRT